MTNCKHTHQIEEKFSNDSYAKELGIELLELTDNSIRMQMKLSDKMNNFFQRPHGGVIYSLADAAFSVIANNQNNISVALDCTITYHNSPNPGETLYVHGRTLSVSKRVGSYLFDVYVLREDKKISIATMKGTAFRTGKAIFD